MQDMPDGHIVLSVLFFKEPSGIWVAQALEHDIAAQGGDLDEAKIAFERTVTGYLRLDAKAKREPLSSLKPAPQPYWAVWERVKRKELQAPDAADSSSVPPAYIITAVTTESVNLPVN